MKQVRTLLLLLAVQALGFADDEPGPESILARAIEAQNGARFAAYLQDFSVDLTLTDTHPERGRIQLDIGCDFKMPDRIRTDVKEPDLSGKEFVEGYDGKVAWHDDAKGLVLFEGRDYAEDRKKLKDTAGTMRQLVRFFFLGNLTRDLTDVQRLADDRYVDPRTGAITEAYVVTGVGNRPDTEGEQTTVKIWVAKTSSNLLGVELAPLADPSDKVTFCFTNHRQNPQQVVVPGTIKIYQRGGAEPAQIIAILTRDDLNQIRFNVGLKDERFAPPAQR